MTRLEEIKNKYLGTYLLKENANEDLLWLIHRVERLEDVLNVISKSDDGDNAGRARTALEDDK